LRNTAGEEDCLSPSLAVICRYCGWNIYKLSEEEEVLMGVRERAEALNIAKLVLMDRARKA